MSILFANYKHEIQKQRFNFLIEAPLLEQTEKFKVYYSPFEYINKDARLVIVGITPGEQQALNALNRAHELLNENRTDEEVLRMVKSHASFSGAMRTNLTKMLDHVGINKKMGINTTSILFNDDVKLAHFTSILKMPVHIKKDGKFVNYGGSNPSIVKDDFLKSQVRAYFLEDVNKTSDAMFLALGSEVHDTLKWLAKQSLINDKQIIGQIPHPSPANSRIGYFLGTATKPPAPNVGIVKLNENKAILLNKLAEIG